MARTLYRTKGRWAGMLMLNAFGYFNLGINLYIRNGGFNLCIQLLIGSITVTYVSPRSVPWMQKKLKQGE